MYQHLTLIYIATKNIATFRRRERERKGKRIREKEKKKSAGEDDDELQQEELRDLIALGRSKCSLFFTLFTYAHTHKF